MSAIVSFFTEILKSEKDTFFRALILGFIVALAITVIIANIMGFLLSGGPLYFKFQDGTGHWFAIIFIVLGFLISWLGYTKSVDSRKDVLSPVREILVGIWEVKYESWYIEENEIRYNWVINTCTIGIDRVGAKLYMRFKVTNSDIFEDTDFEIKNIHIQYQTEPNKLTYFHELKLKIRFDRCHGGQDIVMPLIGMLSFDVKNNAVERMTGKWYDIDNVVYNSIVEQNVEDGIEDLRRSLKNGALTFKGNVIFERIQSPS